MLKIGILGAGYIGKIHISQLKEIAGIRIAGFFDPDTKVSEEVFAAFHIPKFETEDELINAVDVVDIVAPTVEHYRLALKSLQAGKHIFIEKPVTQTSEEAYTLLQLAQERGLKIQVGHVEQFNPAMEAARAFDLHPMFIESHRLAAFNPRGTDVSVVLDLMIHDLDVVLEMVKSPIKSISASGVSIVSETPDIANARLEFENGCVANLTASRISLKKERKMRIFQYDAYILIDFLNKVTEKFALESPENTNSNPLSFTINTGKEHKTIYMDKPPIMPVNAIKAELNSFLAAIVLNLPIKADINSAYQTLKVAHQIIDLIEEREQIFKGQIR